MENTPSPRLVPGKTSTTGDAVLEDPRSGFSVAVPGFPEVDPRPNLNNLPRHEVFIPDPTDQIALLYQLDEVPGALQPGALAVSLATAVARSRADDKSLAALEVRPVAEPWLRLWGAQGAATVRYSSKAFFNEDLLVLRRGAQVVYLYKLTSAVTDPVRLRWYTVAVDNSIRWESPDKLPRVQPVLFPRWSDFLGWGLSLERNEFTQELYEEARDAPTAPEERRALWQRMKDLSAGNEPHTHEVTAEERATYEQYLTDVVTEPVMLGLLKKGLGRVKTAFDLRGFLWAMMPGVSYKVR